MKAAIAAALAAGVVGAGFFGAGTAGAADPLCATNHVVENPVLSIAGDVATFSGSTRPGCEGAPVFVASYGTAHMSFDPSEHQSLINSVSGVAGPDGVHLVLTLEASNYQGQCQRQVDAGSGVVLDHVDGDSRYNELAINHDSDGDGRIVNRLAAVQYAAGECVPPPITVARVTPAPEWPPPVTPEAGVPVHFDIPLEEAPPAPTPPAPPSVELSENPPVALTRTVSIKSLPVTGPSMTFWFAVVGASVAALGIGMVFGASRCSSVIAPAHKQ